MHILCDWSIGPGCRSSLPCSCDLCLGAWGLPRAPSTEQLLACCRDRPPSWNNTACSQTGLGSSSAGQLWANVQEAWIIEGFSIQKKPQNPPSQLIFHSGACLMFLSSLVQPWKKSAPSNQSLSLPPAEERGPLTSAGLAEFQGSLPTRMIWWFKFDNWW